MPLQTNISSLEIFLRFEILYSEFHSTVIEPISNLLEIPPLLTKVDDRVVEVLLILVIRCNPQV